jgi:hypothetical protein
MSIDSLYKSYFQKSKTFLFPLLGIPKGILTSPINTFLSWSGCYTVEDMMLICLYQTVDVTHHLIANRHFFSHPAFKLKAVIDKDTTVYVFDLSKFKNDYELFLQGKYSKLSETSKQAITRYFGIGSPEHEYLDTYLYPDKYYELYGQLMDINPSILKEVVELCDLYDPEKEKLTYLAK